MQRKDISDYQICKIIDEAWKHFEDERFPHEILANKLKCPEKVVYAAMERAYDHGLIEYGVSLRSGWLTEKGKELIRE